MKKFRFNRFNMIIFCASLVLLISFLLVYLNTFSDYVKKDPSKIEGDTVYVNDLASDYYYYLGMNYVGDLNSNSVNYQESDLKMVTINYYAYPSDNTSLTGYVSLTEKQNKFVYYKYYPIKNNQIQIELIDNPFVLRPAGYGFGGWQSTDGTISKDNNTNTYTLTVNSSKDVINVYADWQTAKVVFLKGEDGDDNFDGSSDYNAVASWGRAFELLRNNSSNINDRELNIIVLTGDLDHTINYTRRVTHTWNYTYTYTDNESFENGETYLIEYKSGNNRYALSDNSSNIAREVLSTTTKPSDRSLWTISSNNDGFLIKNKYTGNYLGYVQNNNYNVNMFISSTPYYWNYDTTLRTFYTTFDVTTSKYDFSLNDNADSGTYLITDKNSYTDNNDVQTLNVLTDSLTNTTVNTNNYNETNTWHVNKSGSTYTFQNTTTNSYLNAESIDGNVSLTNDSTAMTWTYNNTNNILSSRITNYEITYQFDTSTISEGTFFIGYQSGNSYYLLNSDMDFIEYSDGDVPSNDMEWSLVRTGSNYYLRNSDGAYIRSNRGNLSLTTSTNNRTAFTLNNNRLYVYQSGNYRYLYNSYGSLATTTSQYNSTQLYHVDLNENTVPGNQIDVYLNYNNGNWNVSTSSGTPISFANYTRQVTVEPTNFYLRYNTTNNSFTFDNLTNGTGLYFATYVEDRQMASTSRDRNISNNSNYSSSYNVAVTITSMYDNTDYRNNATLIFEDSDYFRTIAQNDLQLEYLKIDAGGYQSIDDSSTTSDLRTSNASLVGNSYNVRIGRGMTPSSWDNTTSTTFAYVQGGSDSSVGSSGNNNNAYKLVIESGRYSGLMASHINNNYSNTNYYNYYGTVYLTMGCDYDRVKKTDNNLDVFYRIGSKNYYGVNGKSNYHDIAYLMTIKSGSIGMYYFNNNTNAARAYAGIYVGGLTVNATSQNDDISSRVLIVEGGSVANINGGLRITENSGNSNVSTRIYVKGGTVQNIVGGAGVSTTYGDRYISVTGGNVAYSISGGSNGIAATDESQQSGRLGGDSYVHVGGNAHIGTSGSGTLYDVNYGSVLGAGNGNQNYRTSGRVNTSHVYISGEAIIEGNVYGGGNFGPVLEDSNIKIDGGTINGNVYGGANRNGVGVVAINETTIYNVLFDDNKTPVNGTTYVINKANGNTRNLLSENNNRGTYNVVLEEGYQPSTYSQWLINSVNDGYTIRNLNYNYYLGYTTNTTPSLTINNNTNNSVWNYDTTNKTFYRDISYATSTNINYNFTTNITSGTEYVITNTNNVGSAYSLDSDVSRTALSTTNSPLSNVWIFTASGSGYTIRNKDTGEYLGIESSWFSGTYLTTSNSETVWTWSSGRVLSTRVSGWYGGGTTYYLRYDNNDWTITTTNTQNNSSSIYLATFNETHTMANGRYYLVFENNAWRISSSASSIMLSTYTTTSSLGYLTSNKSNGDVNITMNSGNVLGAIYGGACEEGNVAGTVTININGGDIGLDSNNNGSVFGGGYGENTFIASGVNLSIADAKNVNIDGTVYGGSALGTIIGSISANSTDNNGNGTITIDGDFYCGSMGDSDNNSTGSVQGNCTLSVDGGTYKGSLFGGNNANGSPSGVVTVTTGGNNETTINSVYGGGNEADSTASKVTVNIENNSSITNAFGGGNEAAVPNTIVNLHGGTVTNIYGGSNKAGNITTSIITATGGTATNVYGGNNLGGTTSTSTINADGSTITNLYGGGNEAVTDITNINLNSGTITNTYGGGNQAGISTSTNILLDGATCTSIYGGSNTSGNVPISNVTATKGSADTIYGGNNIGGKTTTSNVDISNINVSNVYGGGKMATTTTTNVTVNSGTVANVFGGGESANVEASTNVSILGGDITTIYGGSNQSGNVPVSYVDIDSGTINTIYGGNNAGGITTTTNVIVDGGTITNIYGGGSMANSTTTNVTLNNSANEISYIYGGCRQADATTTNITLNNGRCTSVFGGSNTSGSIGTSNVNVINGTYGTIYGGNNAGGKTQTCNVSSEGGTINVIFGGGNNAVSGDTNVIVDNANITSAIYGGGNNANVDSTNVSVQNLAQISGDVYGGGNFGQVLENTTVNINNSTIIGNLYGGGNNAAVRGNTELNVINASLIRLNLYGGGNNGQVLGSTSVDIKNSTISGSAYAGGNGETATVNQDTSITVEGTSRVANHVFGGGNAAQTGLSANDNSHGTVNITGATIYGNVYGGANTSVLYGETVVNIGMDAVTTYTNNNDYIKGNIWIGGTVFGGGEANASGSEVYDFDFISVTKGIIINIDGNGHNTYLDIEGSIFGSGNASRTTGYSRIYINNYGIEGNVKNNVSLQRADLAVLNNSHIALSGATDRTNEYSQVVFSISRITELDLKNNSEIYLENGANLLNKFRSLNSDDTLATVVIDENTHSVNKSTNNRIYINEDKVLNIALNQNVTAYGEVDGMTFFGMFKRDRNDNIVNAMYNTTYTTGDTPLDGELYYFNSGSYVLGLHETNHNIKVDGFYTNYDDPNNPGKILVDYITPTPEDAEHYMWTIGVSVQSYDIELIASKFSTLGTYEFPFINNANGNTTFTVVGFTYDDLDSNVSLVNPDNIPRIASSGTVADNTLGLAIKPGIGWLTVGETYFLTDSSSLYSGTTNYKTENSNITPSFVFYLYHSKNIQTEGLVGTVIVSLLTVTPIDDLTNTVERINFNITITRALFDSTEYEGAMTPGRQYQMFTSSKMDITSKSSLSAYYSLFTQSDRTIYHAGYHRVLTSNVILPVNTKITMIDFASATKPEYYYYIVNQEDNALLEPGFQLNGEAEYELSKFIRMGSLDQSNKYDNNLANSIYYDPDTDIAIEEFIFIVDFSNTNITSDMLDCSLLIEMMDEDNNIMYSVLGIQRSNLVYNLHANQSSVIDIDATVSKNLLYVGDVQDLRVTIDFNQSSENTTNRIVDTTYYDQKMGLKISFFDERGNQINGVDLMGTSIVLDGNNYYARSDGTIRFKIADKVANYYSNIKINTTNSTLISGNYTIKVEAFYSTDGIYFGTLPADYDEVTFRLMSRTYGLEALINDGEIIISKKDGKNDLGSNEMNVTINYEGAAFNPNIKVALYRRTYNDTYDTTYTVVDLLDYFTNELTVYNENNKIYDLLDEINGTGTYTLNTKTESLKTGTYKLEFRLYDGTAYVGEVSKYIVIK